MFKNIGGGIYAIIINKNHIYIGQTNHFKHRENEHFNNLKTNKHTNKYMQNTFNKYGKDFFEFKILEKLSAFYFHKIGSKNQDTLITQKECYWIEYYKNIPNINVMNIANPSTPTAKMSLEDNLLVERIFKLRLNKKLYYKDIAKIVNVSNDIVRNILNGKTMASKNLYDKYKNALGLISVKNLGSHFLKLSDKDCLLVAEIFRLRIEEKLSYAKIANKLNMKMQTVAQVLSEDRKSSKILFNKYRNELQEINKIFTNTKNPKEECHILIENVFKLRLENRLSLEKMAKYFEISGRSINRILHGKSIASKNLYEIYKNDLEKINTINRKKGNKPIN